MDPYVVPQPRAEGGPFGAGAYLFNEDPSSRPEVIVASTGGQVLTRQQAQAALGGGGTTVVVNYAPLMSLADEYELERNLAPLLDKAFKQAGLKQ